MWLEEPEPPQ